MTEPSGLLGEARKSSLGVTSPPRRLSSEAPFDFGFHILRLRLGWVFNLRSGCPSGEGGATTASIAEMSTEKSARRGTLMAWPAFTAASKEYMPKVGGQSMIVSP